MMARDLPSFEGTCFEQPGTGSGAGELEQYELEPFFRTSVHEVDAARCLHEVLTCTTSRNRFHAYQLGGDLTDAGEVNPYDLSGRNTDE